MVGEGTGLGLAGESWWGRLTENERETVRLMARLEQHTFIKKVGEAIIDVTQVASELHAPGVVTIKIKIGEPEPGDSLVSLVAEVSKKMPVAKPLGQYAYYADGRLSEEDTRQAKLPLGRIVEQEDAENRAIISMRSERRVE